MSTIATPDGDASPRLAGASRLGAHPQLSEAIGFDSRGEAYAEIAGARQGSRFAPVLRIDDLASPVSVALHAHARPEAQSSRDAVSVDPLDRIEDTQQLIDADRILRIVHTLNFENRGVADVATRLLLPVHERLLKSVRYDHGKHFAGVLRSLDIDPARIVIEIPPAAAAHPTLLAYVTGSYRAHGFQVAANVADAGRLLTLQSPDAPDYVVLDASSAIRGALVRPALDYAARFGLRLVFDGVADADAVAQLHGLGARYIEMAAPAHA
ncbi:EAL domain-containing protein [Chitinasiproducens palmae]|uniref:EAL domain-containing protein n=1 Tax=Chitinasiproducens palmae TaxID=1770053 RepID=A0A1H2PJC1_9BURK|nr:EAL domain-containing protein [Chitinasiproducens palmae]SDV46474.1 EAL domain-containing protein [Chitinasiproducens palmae]